MDKECDKQLINVKNNDLSRSPMDSEYSSENVTTELIHGSIETVMQVLEMLPSDIEAAADTISQCLLNENKVLCCGTGQSAALSQLFASNLLNRFQYERPSLPAINLSADATTLTAIAGDNAFQDVFASQIRALGQPGDVLLLISHNNSNSLLQAIQSAHDREMTVIALISQSDQDVTALMLPDDLELRAPTDNRPRVAEAHLLISNCICALIDQHLFGGF